jgi:hypothetical protein
MSRQRLTRLGFLASVLAAVALSGCIATRRDFPSWRFIEPQWVSDQLTTGQEDMPDVAVNRFGQAVVVWSDKPAGDDAEIWWRRYDKLGQPLTPAVRITNNAYSDYYPRIAYVLGTTYIVWMGDEFTSSNIWWVAVNDAGSIIAGPTMISDPAQNDYDPRIYYCGESHVIWSGDHAATNFSIYYAKIANSGTIDLPYRPISGFFTDERDAVGAIDNDCNTLHVAYVHEVSLTDDNVMYTAVDTGTGTNITTSWIGFSFDDENEPAIAVANDINGVTRRVNIAWQYVSPTAYEIQYASRNPNGSGCSPMTPLTNDTLVDQGPAILGTVWAGNPYTYVAWERTGANFLLDIYGSLFVDDCTPTPPAPVLISNSTASAGQNDRHVQVIHAFSPSDMPIFATVWRGLPGGAVFARFGVLSNTTPQIGTAERISSAASDGYAPPPYLVTPELAVGGSSGANHLRVVWLGTDGTATDVYLQQTAWQTTSPLILNNHSGDAPASP